MDVLCFSNTFCECVSRLTRGQLLGLFLKIVLSSMNFFWVIIFVYIIYNYSDDSVFDKNQVILGIGFCMFYELALLGFVS
ncbi:hypothetical protein CsatA_009918 [Cannabis sativa]